jgi:hypothetical protein
VNVRKWVVTTVTTVTLASLTIAPTLSAQIGHVPQSSPYTDLEYRQELSLFGGHYNAGKDKVGVAPGNGPTIGLRYDLRLGGPALLTSRLQYVSSSRTIIDPRRPADSRVVEANASWPIYLWDVGINVNLTGQRSYRHVVPFLNGSLGVATDFKGGADVGAWRFGTPFAFSFGGGVKWVPGGNWQVRGDFSDHLYQIKYPNSYYDVTSDGTSVLGNRDSKSDWTNNLTLSIGVSYLFFR